MSARSENPRDDREEEGLGSFYEACAGWTMVLWVVGIFVSAVLAPRDLLAVFALCWPVPLAAAAITGHLGASLFYAHPEVALNRRIRKAQRQRALIELQAQAEAEERRTEEAFQTYITSGM